MIKRWYSKWTDFIEWYTQPEQQKVVLRYRKWFWVALLIVSILFGFISSTVFISVLSIWALYLTDSAGEQAADAQLEAKDDHEDIEDEAEEANGK